MVVKEKPAVKRNAPDDECNSKRAKPEHGEMDVELDALRKLVTVGPHTQVSAEEPPQEETGAAGSMAWDDASGEELDPEEVQKARATEMAYVEGRGVWRKAPRSLAVGMVGK